MFSPTHNKTTGNEEESLQLPSVTPSEPRVKYAVDVMIPPECMDDEGECEHIRKPEKVIQNPV